MALTRLYLIRGAWRQVWRYRLRSALTVSCASLGLAGAITSSNYASGGRQRVLDEIRRLGTNIVTVTADQSRAVAGRARTGGIVTTLREADYRALERDADAAVRASPIVSRPFRLKAGDSSRVSTIVGCEPGYFAIKSWDAAQGGLFDEADVRRSARVAVVGRSVAVDLYGDASPVGRRLFVNRVPFEVVGVLAERGQGLDVTNEDEQVYVPLTTAMRRLMNVDYFSAIAFEIRDWRDMDEAAGAIARVLGARHRRAAGTPPDFVVQNQKELVDTELGAAARLGFLVRWVGASGLLVAGLGVLAIAWISARERAGEIGTRRALGATAGDVFFQFAVEAGLLSMAGLAGGLALAWIGSRAAAARAGLPFVFDRPGAMAAAAAAAALNLGFAAWPAVKAARLDPIRALKHE